MLQTALQFSHTLLQEVVQQGDQVIDATIGNGYDTRFLAELVGETGHVYGYDVQEQARQATIDRLGDLIDRTTLHLSGHQTIDATIPVDLPIQAAIFNLGYLPKSNKQIITLPETTQIAMEAILERLTAGGRMVIVIYYGHDGGEKEKHQVLHYCKTLPQEQFSVLSYQFINQRGNPPILICVEKK
ncbi:rRNA methyltransferase [Enterococcus florum]|uniref:rRNA methyltransferase n=1 Tax=Enterococcus florum TaxID=2480627 RepID=A0A4P5P616_9ENTE|nr:class I SAM-dependent methyltransferase [Enterococcus florum]GCF93150.1 rRNA methyltransferase [Enterococcus florum]